LVDDRPNLQERMLAGLLRLGGGITLCAFGALLLPTRWMASMHASLGLGEFPDGPLTQYLTRSISALYGFHGGLLLLVSRDLRRFAPIVSYLGAMNLVLGIVLLLVDLRAGMPLAWTLAEGPPLSATGLVLLALSRAIPPSRARPRP
jgi:hypothetical protein